VNKNETPTTREGRKNPTRLSQNNEPYALFNTRLRNTVQNKGVKQNTLTEQWRDHGHKGTMTSPRVCAQILEMMQFDIALRYNNCCVSRSAQRLKRGD